MMVDKLQLTRDERYDTDYKIDICNMILGNVFIVPLLVIVISSYAKLISLAHSFQTEEYRAIFLCFVLVLGWQICRFLPVPKVYLKERVD